MESMVLIALYKNANGAPPINMKNSGAITPSEVFSATVSTAAFATSSSVSSAVSRPTIHESFLRASCKSPLFSPSYTCKLASLRERIAKI